MSTAKTELLKDLWNDSEATHLASNPLALLRYRSNLLGTDLRITNFGGGNTSSKYQQPDPFTALPTRVMAVKGSGGDIGSIKESGFAILYMERLNQLKSIYRGEAHEDEIVSYYPLSAFGHNKVAASIDTALHAFLPWDHVDHLHPDWAIAIAASANGERKMHEYNKEFNANIIWIPWQRPGFELALMLEKGVQENPAANGLILGSHGLFTWGNTQRECYVNSIETIDQMGRFINAHQTKKGTIFGGLEQAPIEDRKDVAAAILPALRGICSSNRRQIGHHADHEDALVFAGSAWAKELCALGTSCPDHFLRTRICPMFIDWKPAEGLPALKQRISEKAVEYRK
jgi:rhamnose utilization protein RhaD (predicted bifunctional aldolase and dehydrogenase)